MTQLNFIKTVSSNFGTLLIAVLISFFTALISTSAAAQDAKIDKAVANFCTKLDGFILSLEALDQANETGTYKEFDKAYKKAVKAWNKFVKSADKLENVEYKDSAQAYNDLVDAVNLIKSENIDDKTTKKIDKHVDSASDTVLSLRRMHCE